MKKTKSLRLVITCFVINHIYTIYQFTYFLDVFNHGVTNDPTITLIQYLHQNIHTEYDCNVENNVYLRLNINRIGFTGEAVTG